MLREDPTYPLGNVFCLGAHRCGCHRHTNETSKDSIACAMWRNHDAVYLWTLSARVHVAYLLDARVATMAAFIRRARSMPVALAAWLNSDWAVWIATGRHAAWIARQSLRVSSSKSEDRDARRAMGASWSAHALSNVMVTAPLLPKTVTGSAHMATGATVTGERARAGAEEDMV